MLSTGSTCLKEKTVSNNLREQAEKNKILEIVHGSHLYGTSTPESDEDFVGVFLPPADYVFGLKSVEEVDLGFKDKGDDGKNTAAAVDRKLYEFRKFLRLCLDNNPNILEVLFVNDENIIHVDDRFGKALLEMKEIMPSKRCIPKFIGYANAQKHKMVIKQDHFNELMSGYRILEITEDKLTMGQLYDRMDKSSDYKNLFLKKGGGLHIHVGDICFEPGVYVKKARRRMKERLDKVTNRVNLFTKYGFDTKFASHLIRLLYEGIELLETGKLEFPLKKAPMLRAIRDGEMKMHEVLQLADDIQSDIENLKVKSDLRDKPEYNKVEEFCMCTMILSSVPCSFA